MILHIVGDKCSTSSIITHRRVQYSRTPDIRPVGLHRGRNTKKLNNQRNKKIPYKNTKALLLVENQLLNTYQTSFKYRLGQALSAAIAIQACQM